MQNLLSTSFRQQMLMDGQYGSITFVATKTDDVSPSEIVESLATVSGLFTRVGSACRLSVGLQKLCSSCIVSRGHASVQIHILKGHHLGGTLQAHGSSVHSDCRLVGPDSLPTTAACHALHSVQRHDGHASKTSFHSSRTQPIISRACVCDIPRLSCIHCPITGDRTAEQSM